MKLMKFFSLLLFCILTCSTYAHENKYIFIGQNGDGASATTAFILEVSADAESAIITNEAGEIYLKADKIVAIPAVTLSNFANFVNSANAEGALQNAEFIGEAWRCYNCGKWNTDSASHCWNCKIKKS